jgi:hypothetical protein
MTWLLFWRRQHFSTSLGSDGESRRLERYSGVRNRKGGSTLTIRRAPGDGSMMRRRFQVADALEGIIDGFLRLVNILRW